MKILVLACLLFGSLAFADQPASQLQVSVIPTNPIVIPYGTATIFGHTLQAPFYIVNSLGLHWMGQQDLTLVSITLTPDNATDGAPCVYAGDELNELIPTIDGNTNEVVIAHTSFINTRGFGCEGLSLPMPTPAIFNVPVTVTAVGVVKIGDHLERVTGSAHIVLQ